MGFWINAYTDGTVRPHKENCVYAIPKPNANGHWHYAEFIPQEASTAPGCKPCLVCRP